MDVKDNDKERISIDRRDIVNNKKIREPYSRIKIYHA